MRDITPINHNGSIQLKFSVSGKRYGFNPIPGGDFNNRRDIATAKAIATNIQNDVLAGIFDPTLNRYRLTPKIDKETPTTLLQLWDLWVASLELPAHTQANHYKWVRRMLSEANPGINDTEWLIKADLAPRTFNDRLKMVRTCCKWAITQDHISVNPYLNVKLRKDNPKEIKPFTIEEIQLILEGFDTLAPHYSPFVRFLMSTGVRTSEAIGLRWGHIDFNRGEITIKESLPKDLTGNGYTRVRKETKTGNIRRLPLSEQLRSLFRDIRPTKAAPDDLIFTTPNGHIIDADNFRDRQWRKVLETQGISYRKPYTTRHTMVSHAIEQGIPITGVAYLAGHKDTTMIIKNYGHMINRPDLPDIPIG